MPSYGRRTKRLLNSLPLDFFEPPLLGRTGFNQQIIDKAPLIVNDDVVSFVRAIVQLGAKVG